MIIRTIIIFSLVAQLALSYRCCGITILCVCLATPASCVAGGCSEEESECCIDDSTCGSICEPVPQERELCCGDSSAATCDEAALACGVTNQECPEQSCPFPPIDTKSLASTDIGKLPDLLHYAAPFIHPVIDAASPYVAALHEWDRLLPPRFKSNHQRQAWLEVWLN